MFLRYWRILAPFHKVFAWFVLLLVAFEGLQILEGYTISLAIRFFGSQVDFTTWFVFAVALLVFDEVIMRIDNYLDWHVITKQSLPIYKHLKLGAVSKFLKLDITWHQKHNSGTLVGKVSNGVEKVNEIVEALSWEFVPTIVQTILSIVTVLIITPQSACVAIVAFAIFFWLTLKANQEKKKLKEARYDLYEVEWHRSIEVVQSVETNIMFGQTERLLAEQNDLHSRIQDLGIREAYVGIYKYNKWRIRILRIARRLILAIWVYQLYTGTMDIASLIFVSVLTEKLFFSFWRIARLLDRVAEASEGANRLATILEEDPNTKEGGSSPALNSSVGITLQDVCFAYSHEYSLEEGILHDLSVEFPAGGIVALVGPSGAGKTTIRKIITRLIDIQSGKIEVGGLDIQDWSMDELLSLFSYVPQGDDVFIFAGTLQENIAFPRPTASFEEIQTAAKLSGIHEFILSLPDGYKSVVGERGKRLSGGQKQRIALARAILANRPILILDEATSAVDAITEDEIQKSMSTILAGKTAIIIAHRLSTIWDISDKIVVLDRGRKIEEGTHDQLIRQGGLYAKMVALQTTEVC